MVTEEQVEQFLSLFQGNGRSFGQWNPNSKSKMLTVKSEYTTEHARAHLEGEIGLGMVPIRDDNKCLFAAIDIDVHGPNGGHVDLIAIESRIAKAALPLIVCRSKSGGAHCYLFLKEPEDANSVRLMLGRWAAVVGHPTAEIFPKQAKLDPPKGSTDRPLGNWINLPYFMAEGTDRYALDGGKEVNFDYFIEMAEGKRASLSDYSTVASEVDYSKGPPCVAEMVRNKVEEGNRNLAAFQAGIFLKRAFPEDWRTRLEEFNKQAFVSPLNVREMRTIGGSISKKDYQYKCREEPCKTLCNKDLCKTREFGISKDDSTANEIPIFDAVEKVIATPVRWVLRIGKDEIEVTTPQLFNYDMVRQAVGERLHIVLPRIKNQEWDQYLREIMSKVQVRRETTIEDMIFQKLCEYLRRVRVDKTRPEDDRREDLRRGQPALISITRMTFINGKAEAAGECEWYFAFRLFDFVDYLTRKKALPVPAHQIATCLTRVLGEDAKRDKMRVGPHRVTNVWCVPEKSVEEESVPAKTFEQEF
jgi:hypothetical protein